MENQFNPFHHWLGFDENLRQPNHFQLFGVKANLEDPIGFRKKIHTRAKAMLKQLELMTEEEIAGRRKLHTKLRRHIVKAHEILLDDKLRAGYLKGLRQKVRDAKGSAKPLAVPPPQKSTTSEAEDKAASETGNLGSATMKRSPTPTIKQASDVAAPSSLETNVETGAIPMAIPLSKPDAPEFPDVNPQSTDEVNFDNLKSEEIVIRPGRVKRKRSWLMPILCVVMTLFCVAGISALVTNFGNQFASSPKPAENDATPPDVTNKNKVLNNENSEAPVVPPTPEEIRKATEDLVNSKSEDVELNGGMGSDTKSPKATAVAPKDTAKPAGVMLPEAKLHSIRFLFDRARKEMKRGRLESAAEQYDMAKAAIGSKRLHGDQSYLAAHLKNGRGMIKHLEGFYGQVRHSSMKITGGELEPEPGVIIGFVEGRDKDVVLRFGENVAIPYRSLRPGLAMLLASKKGAPNVPAWRLQEAAYRLIQTNGSDETKAKVEELLVAAEADEYDASAIRGFMDLGSTFPESTMTAVSKEQMSQLTKTMVGNKYSRIGKLDPKEAWKYAKEFSTDSHEDPSMRIAALSESVKLAVRAGDAFQMVDAIDELSVWTDFGSAARKSVGFTDIATRLPEGADARPVGEAFFEFLGSPDASALEPRKLKRLKQRIVDLVAANGLDDLRRLISQTME